jgi:hypothetical protein
MQFLHWVSNPSDMYGPAQLHVPGQLKGSVVLMPYRLVTVASSDAT